MFSKDVLTLLSTSQNHKQQGYMNFLFVKTTVNTDALDCEKDVQ